MQFEDNRVDRVRDLFEDGELYRVREVAARLRVSGATVYRAVECGRLDALKIGTGKGTIRITGKAANVYVKSCAEAAYRSFVVDGEPADDAVADGRACVVCGAGFLLSGPGQVPVPVFACEGERVIWAARGEVVGEDFLAACEAVSTCALRPADAVADANTAGGVA